MSQKVDSGGNVLGPYCEDDLACLMDSPIKMKGRKGKERKETLQHKQRVLHYDLIWEITEMQVKLLVQAIFPNQTGRLFSQLAKERVLDIDEKTVAKESRSTALEKDIQLTHPEILEKVPQKVRRVESVSNERVRPADGILESGEFQRAANAPVSERPAAREEENFRLATEQNQEQPVAHNDLLATQQPVLPTFQSHTTGSTNHQHQFNKHSLELDAVGEFHQLQDGVQITNNLNNLNNVGVLNNTML
jgi:hypothetical protein